MERVYLAIGLAAVALTIAVVVQRRQASGQHGAPVRTGYRAPAQLARGDFSRPDAPWLVVVFTSATCASCPATWEKARHLASDAVAVDEVEVTARGELHRRYGIEAVPITVVADAEGAVQASFIGPVTATDLWAAVAEVREPGSRPEGCGPGGA